jgi:hypothetical protein
MSYQLPTSLNSRTSPRLYSIDDRFGKIGYRFGLEKDSGVLVEIYRASPKNNKLILTLMNLFYGELLNEKTRSERGDSCLYSYYPLT